MYEFKVIRVPQKWWEYGPSEKAVETVITENTRDGWDLATVFSLPEFLGFVYNVMVVFKKESVERAGNT